MKWHAEAKSRREKIPDDACDLDNSNEDYPVPSALFGLYERKVQLSTF